MDMPVAITVTPIRRPVYYSWNVRDYGRWFADNQQTLTDYWNELMTADAAGPIGEDDFFLFCVCQHECEQDRMEEFRRCYG